MSVIVALKAQKRRQQQGQITLLHLQRAWYISPYTQGVATLCPGLCASVLTAHAGYCIFANK